MDKVVKLTVALLTLISLSAKASEHHHSLPLDLSFQEYQKLWHDFSEKADKDQTEALDDNIKQAINGGEKFSQWLNKINQARSAENQIRLTSSSNRRGIPIDKPSKYGPKTIEKRLNNLLVELPNSIKKVVYADTAINSEVPTDVETFIKYGRKVKGLYSTAVRWSTSILPWLSWYKRNKRRDVRGYYYLNKMEDLDENLRNFQTLSTETQKVVKKHLLGICQNNNRSLNNCKRLLERRIAANGVLNFKNSFWTEAKATWDSFFKIKNRRTDVVWSKNAPDEMNVTFVDPDNDVIKDFLKDNIEDEFKTNSWNLNMSFKERGGGTAYIQFKPNVTPHVTGGNIIVMDANTSIEEYAVKWTIRHEYGHILRLPDCYVEFYDEAEEVAVNYQLDTTDLMCSRAGDFNQRIYLELKEKYFR
jgi:hypothetical protein